MVEGNYISTWLYADKIGESSKYHQVQGNSAELEFQKVYWRAICVFFACSTRFNPNARHIFFTNAPVLPVVDKLDVALFLQEHKVEVVKLEMTYKVPEGFYHAWRNQFYLFDIIKYVNGHFSDDSNFLILDSDCIFSASAEPVFQAMKTDPVLTYDIDYAPNHVVNGLSRTDLRIVFEELSGNALSDIAHYCGGEFFAARVSEMKKIQKVIDQAWQLNLERFKEGRIKFNEEAQILSYIYWVNGYRMGTGNSFIRRIWTYPFMDTTTSKDLDLIIWHLPYEKNIGIKQLFGQLGKNGSQLMELPLKELSYYLSAVLGVRKTVRRNKWRDLMSWTVRTGIRKIKEVKAKYISI